MRSLPGRVAFSSYEMTPDTVLLFFYSILLYSVVVITFLLCCPINFGEKSVEMLSTVSVSCSSDPLLVCLDFGYVITKQKAQSEEVLAGG